LKLASFTWIDLKMMRVFLNETLPGIHANHRVALLFEPRAKFIGQPFLIRKNQPGKR
jgi:hypothetical protein